MNRNKLVIAVIIMLALFFGLKDTAKAYNYLPSDYNSLVESSYVAETDQSYDQQVYHFYLGSEGITDHNGVLHNFVADSCVIDLDVRFGLTHFPIYDDGYLYDFMYIDLVDYFNYTLTFNDYDNGLSSLVHTVVSATPYFVVGGEKHYLAQASHNFIDLGKIQNDTTGQYGLELQILYSYSGNTTSNVPREWYGVSTLSVHSARTVTKLYGAKYLDTGDVGIIDSITSQGWFIENAIKRMHEDLSAFISEVAQNTDRIADFCLESIDLYLSDIYYELFYWLPDISSKLSEISEKLGSSNVTSGDLSLGQIMASVGDAVTDAIFSAIDDLKVQVVYYGTYIGEAIFSLPELLSSYIYDATESGADAIKDAVSAQFDELFDYLAIEFVDYFTTVNGWLGRFEDKFDDQTEFVEIYMAKIYDLVGLKFDNLITYLGEEFVSYFTSMEAFIGRLETSIENFNHNLDFYFGEVETRLSSIITSLGSIDSLLSGIVDGESSDSGSSGGSSSGDDDNASSDIFERIENAESGYIADSYENLDSYELPADGLNGFSQGFVSAITFVSSMMQALFVKAGSFATTVSVSFMLVISSMALGLFRFFR